MRIDQGCLCTTSLSSLQLFWLPAWFSLGLIFCACTYVERIEDLAPGQRRFNKKGAAVKSDHENLQATLMPAYSPT